MKRPTRTLIALVFTAFAVTAGSVHAADGPGRLRVGKPHRLRVTHTTRVKVEEGTARLDVWHAKPQSRLWPGSKAPLGVERVTLSPTGGNEMPTHSEGGLGWVWKIANPAVGAAEYVSTFDMVSADRELKTAGLNIPWSELPKDTTDVMKGLPALPTANERVREAFVTIKKKGKDVVSGLEAFAQWINQHIAYTPGVAYATDNLDAICRGGGGHCGHRATVFLAFCEAAGIPARRVVGYAFLNRPTGGIGVDDSNRHVWVEVNLPNLGWVEVEPAPHGSPFAISYLFVLCPLDLQSRFVEANTKAGVRSMPIVADTLRMEELK